ncbi:TetR/AcrR family transcriptional regulator [Rhizobium jaguaris]|uniref:TetR/AcrR family transcriptional regulator n=1 Tax=Rhizobium jaguaris TaxID=1312183 RepID=A0A387FGN1_9HYPH|nr:TetR/AcrR family transcriptional regulator [Rhizobium jaguaris]AYG57978.1 TetR/AcrR family transcriptional regulator [Rhizobium jaguaris]
MVQEPFVKRRRSKDEAGTPRRIPSQQRGRERVERILSVAMELIEKNGSDALRMGEIVEKAGVSFGSLYQYFPDKTAIIRVLAERFNEQGRQCVGDELAAIASADELQAAVGRIVDGYYAMFLDEPVMRDIWHATQADKLLQEIDDEDMEWHSQAFLAVLRRLWPERDCEELARIARLTMQLVAAAVRYAISIEKEEGDKAIALFKAMLPADIGAVAERLSTPQRMK